MPPIIKSVRGIHPTISKDAWVAENATITGDVHIMAQSTVWFHAVIRGDVAPIRLGEACNIQDQAVLHATYQQSSTELGNRVSVGHSAIVHGAQVADDVLIGMGAIIMDHVRIEAEVIVAAGSLVPSNKTLESGYIYAGRPAKKFKKMEKKHIDMIQRTARHYPEYASWMDDVETI